MTTSIHPTKVGVEREHAAAILLELKETAVLRDGDLVGITRND